MEVFVATATCGFYGFLAARGSTNDPLVAAQVLIVCVITGALLTWYPDFAKTGSSDLTIKHRRLFKLGFVVVLIIYTASIIVLLGGRRAIFANKWSVVDDDDVEIFVLDSITQASYARLGVSTTFIKTNATEALRSIKRRAPWTVVGTAVVDVDVLQRLENGLHENGHGIDVVDFGEGLAVRRKTVFPDGDASTWCATIACAFC